MPTDSLSNRLNLIKGDDDSIESLVEEYLKTGREELVRFLETSKTKWKLAAVYENLMFNRDGKIVRRLEQTIRRHARDGNANLSYAAAGMFGLLGSPKYFSDVKDYLRHRQENRFIALFWLAFLPKRCRAQSVNLLMDIVRTGPVVDQHAAIQVLRSILGRAGFRRLQPSISEFISHPDVVAMLTRLAAEEDSIYGPNLLPTPMP